MKTRYSFGGDEHLVAEVDEEMSLEAFFKVLLITNLVREQAIAGVLSIGTVRLFLDRSCFKPRIFPLEKAQEAVEAAAYTARGFEHVVVVP